LTALGASGWRVSMVVLHAGQQHRRGQRQEGFRDHRQRCSLSRKRFGAMAKIRRNTPGYSLSKLRDGKMLMAVVSA
jgi:hypothetical protein